MLVGFTKTKLNKRRDNEMFSVCLPFCNLLRLHWKSGRLLSFLTFFSSLKMVSESRFLQIYTCHFRIYSLNCDFFSLRFFHSMTWLWSSSISWRCFTPDTKRPRCELRFGNSQQLRVRCCSGLICAVRFCTTQAANCQVAVQCKTFVWLILKTLMTFPNLSSRPVLFNLKKKKKNAA